ncbi:hypothetical protein [Streptomyces sp. SID8352]|uniref:hypothetical protein n=1 Tax=Streptomyces sp. SID8352 TaxID=2690338 RepID=UPI001F32ED23|nr:hypothetical protein [Streptomyces sp. SID8352]
MADQIARGYLVPVDDAAESEPPAGTPLTAEELARVEAHAAASERTATPEHAQAGGAEDGVKRPNANSKVDDWRVYAVSLGMPEEDAADATKAELQDWVKVAESATEGSGD